MQIKNDDGQVVFDRPVKDGATIELPYGKYSAALTSSLMHAEKSFEVRTPEAALILAGAFKQDDVPPYKCRVQIQVKTVPCAEHDLAFVRLVGVFKASSMDQELSKADSADFGDVQGGEYVAMIISGKEVRGFKAFQTRGSQTTVLINENPCRAATKN